MGKVQLKHLFTSNESKDQTVQEENKKNGTLQKETEKITYTLTDATVTFPADWIALNPEEAERCRYAGVVECKNSVKYGIPHFVFFAQSGSGYSDAFMEYVEGECIKKWKPFALVMKLQIEYEQDGSNCEEFMEAPTVGIFPVMRDDESMIDAKDVPYGIQIVVNK